MVEQEVYLFLHKEKAKNLGLNINDITVVKDLNGMKLPSSIIYFILVGNEKIPLYTKLVEDPEYDKKTISFRR